MGYSQNGSHNLRQHATTQPIHFLNPWQPIYPRRTRIQNKYRLLQLEGMFNNSERRVSRERCADHKQSITLFHVSIPENGISRRTERDGDDTHDLSLIESRIDSPKNTRSGFNYDSEGLSPRKTTVGPSSLQMCLFSHPLDTLDSLGQRTRRMKPLRVRPTRYQPSVTHSQGAHKPTSPSGFVLGFCPVLSSSSANSFHPGLLSESIP